MKLKIFVLFILSNFLVGSISAQYKSANKFIKKFDNTIPVVKVEEGSTQFPCFEFEKFTIKTKVSTDTLPQFYMAKHEVSVQEYYQYLQYLIANKLDSQFVKNYPDTLVFLKAYSWLYNEILSQVYFWHPKSQNYPIVGISKLDADDYLNWLKNELVKKSIEKFGYNVVRKVRLPTHIEWRRVITFGKIKDEDDHDYMLIHSKNHYTKVNTGQIVSEYRATVYNYDKDGFTLTNPVNELEKNKLGIYNLLGNVSEFCSDTVKFYKSEFKYSEYTFQDIDDTLRAKNKIVLDSLSDLEDNGDLFAIAYNHPLLNKGKFINTYNFNNNNSTDISLIHCYIVGASWKDDIKYLNPNELRIIGINDRKSYVGFRYVIDFYTDEELSRERQ